MPDTVEAGLVGRRIFVVEDDYLIAACLADQLEELGAVVSGPAATVSDAIELLNREDGVDAAILDVNIRGEKVYPVADKLRARGVPFVFATGYDDWVVPECYAAVPRIEKPADIDRLTRALVRTLADGKGR